MFFVPQFGPLSRRRWVLRLLLRLLRVRWPNTSESNVHVALSGTVGDEQNGKVLSGCISI